MALKLDILANTRQLVTEMKKGGASVEDVTDALDDLARDGDQATEKLERSFKDLAKQADKTGRSVGTDLDKGFDKAKRGADDFKEEGASTMRETAASISSVEDALGAVQEIAANAFVGFGPIGAGAGLVGAIGFGLLLENMQKQNEEAEKLKTRLTDAYSEAADEGRAYLDTAQLIAEANSLMFDTDRADEWKRVQEDAEKLGLDVNEVIRANAGDLEAQRQVQDAINALVESGAGTYETIRDGISKTTPEVQGLVDRWGSVFDKTADARDASQRYRDFMKNTNETERAQIEKTKAADQSRYEALAQHYAKPIEGNVNLKVNVDETALTAAKNRADAWARAGLNVAVTGTLSGKVWE